MTMKEARKTIVKHNKLRKEIERLRDRLWHEPISGKGFKLCQLRLKEAEQELADNAPAHKQALKAYLYA